MRTKRIISILFIIVAIFSFLILAGGSAVPAEEEITKININMEGIGEGNVELLTVHFIDVGQADSILIRQGNLNMLIDAGNNADGRDVVNYLKENGVSKIDYLIGTHPHEDHIGGLDDVIKAFEIGKIFMPKASTTTRTFEDVLLAVREKGLKVTTPVPGSRYRLGEAEWVILAPNSQRYKDLNNYSIVVRLEFGGVTFLFTGDAETESEREMLAARGNLPLKADILKVGHHGSGTSTSEEFLEAVDPDYAVICVGKGNRYGHPGEAVLERLSVRGIKILRTDLDGTIVFVVGKESK